MMEGKQLAPRDLFRKGYEPTDQKPDGSTTTVFDEILKKERTERAAPLHSSSSWLR
ncbi:hypothetical protein C7459_118106 [Tumebacillus permanentifrigoris]|uniref:Uncharacterized protein n=1 Tax=Tumebacillus permanentifrigoris TaxID=378543 RepID=A0A316D5N8_9BACL|nr:hypothetical protein C7459_118106 [Tumebacillus permanentifrigoris]